MLNVHAQNNTVLSAYYIAISIFQNMEKWNELSKVTQEYQQMEAKLKVEFIKHTTLTIKY